MRYFLYARKSEEDEARQVQSIGDQLKLAHQLAEASGLSIARVYQEAHSAKRPNRPVFGEMIQAIERGEADGIIAWHPDRLSRNAVDAGIIIDLLDRSVLHDLQFHSYRFENTPEGKWMLSIVLGQSKYFVDKLSKDVKRGLRSKLEKGHYPQLAPLGYLNDRANRTIIADPERFPLMRRSFELILSRSHTPAQVLRILNGQWGLRTPRTAKRGGGPLSQAAFYRLLINPFYTGLMEYKGELFQGQHPPLLAQHEFDEVGRILGRGFVAAPQKYDFPFRGLLRCGLCGGAVTAETKVKRYPKSGRSASYTYYHCTGARGCSKVSITQNTIEAQVRGLLDRVTLSPSAALWCLEPAQAWHQAQSQNYHGNIETLTQALHGAERRKTNLLNAHLSEPDLFSWDELREHKALLQDEINGLRREIKAAEEELERVRTTVENVFDFAVHAKERFETGNTAMRRHIASCLGVHYVLTLGKLDIEPHPLLVPILGIELPKIGSTNNKNGSEDTVPLVWQALGNTVRTLSVQHKFSFPTPEWSSGANNRLDQSGLNLYGGNSRRHA